jgi:hypothetical protein
LLARHGGQPQTCAGLPKLTDQQTIPMQTRARREYATRRGWTIALQVSGVNSEAARREAREKLIEAARYTALDP